MRSTLVVKGSRAGARPILRYERKNWKRGHHKFCTMTCIRAFFFVNPNPNPYPSPMHSKKYSGKRYFCRGCDTGVCRNVPGNARCVRWRARGIVSCQPSKDMSDMDSKKVLQRCLATTDFGDKLKSTTSMPPGGAPRKIRLSNRHHHSCWTKNGCQTCFSVHESCGGRREGCGSPTRSSSR